MIGILLVSHGKMAGGMMDSMHLILGEADGMETASLVAGQDFEAFKAEVVGKIKALDQGSGVLVFVDLSGASPYNAAMLSLKELQEQGVSIRVITGMNLPMVMEAVAMRSAMALEELAQSMVEIGKFSIQEPVSTVYQVQDDREDDY